jgi:hypothetical protein
MMISMRYARNLAYGNGLVWNKGEMPVEGFTNPLWVCIMAVFHLFDISAEKISLGVQLINMLILTTNLVFVYKISKILSPVNNFFTFIPVILTAFYYQFVNWSVLGFESGFLSLITTISVQFIIENKRDRKSKLLLFICLIAGILVRQDFFLIAFVIIYLYFTENKISGFKKLIIPFFIILTPILLLTGFRLIYYHGWLPNTYYLKMTGYPVFLRLTRGIYATMKFILHINPLIFILPLIYFFKNRNTSLNPLIIIIIAQLLYNCYIGADAWEYLNGPNRFVSVIIPLLFVVFSFSSGWLYGLSQEKIWKIKYNKIFAVLLIALIPVQLYYMNFPAGIKNFVAIERYCYKDIDDNLRLSQSVIKNYPANTKIAVLFAGIIPYFTDFRSIDLLGKNDKYISHLPMPVSEGLIRFIDFMPGHLKWDYKYSVGVLKPDLILQKWTGSEKIDSILQNDYERRNIDGFHIYIHKRLFEKSGERSFPHIRLCEKVCFLSFPRMRESRNPHGYKIFAFAEMTDNN